MWHWMLILSVATGFVLTQFGELRLNKINFDFLQRWGGEEVAQPLMEKLYRWSAISLILAIFEFIYREFPSNQLQAVGALLLLLGLALRIWSIQSLGTMWSRRCIYIPGVPKVITGPYRFLKHPEYMTRLLETLGYMLIFSAYASGLVCLMAMIYYVKKIIAWENIQLSQNSVHPLDLTHQASDSPVSSAIANCGSVQ